MDTAEFELLKRKYGNGAALYKAEEPLETEKFYRELVEKTTSDRRGEVAFFVQRKNGTFILVRNTYYPKQVYRVPTGGINFGESVEHALLREVGEELGVTVSIHRFLGVIEHRFSYQNQEPVFFYSYVFWLKEESGRLIEDATEDEIAEYLEADANKLKHTAGVLKQTEGPWKDWASFRYQTTRFLLDFIPESN